MSKRLLDIYSDYLITQNEHATATGLSHTLDGEISHYKVSRFLNGINWFSRYVISWRLSNLLDADFCLQALEESLKKGKPDIFNRTILQLQSKGF